MPKLYTFPTLFDNVMQLSITMLKKWEYLSNNHIKKGTVTWSIESFEKGSITIIVNTRSEQPYILLKYYYGDKFIEYRVPFVTISSNLGKGLIWYFLCPQTKKRCRKLYLIDGYFFHREAFHCCLYESQSHSKSYRQLIKTFGVFFKRDDLYRQLYQKHFKKTYAGKPTKRYLRIMEQIQRAEAIPPCEIERIMIS